MKKIKPESSLKKSGGAAGKPGRQKPGNAEKRGRAPSRVEIRHIAERRRAEEHFRSVVETACDGIITVDSAGKIIFWNKAAEILFGYPASEVTGKPLAAILPERYRKAHEQGMRRALSIGESNINGGAVKLEGLRKDGTEFPLELSLATWRVADDVFFTGIVRDITERRQAEEELQKHRDRLEELVDERAAELKAVNAALEREIAERTETERRIRTTNSLLKLDTQKVSLREYRDAAAELIVAWSGCRHVDIRVIEDREHIPFASCAGCGPEFMKSESRPSPGTDRCACIRMISGEEDPPDSSVMTPDGSFYSNNVKQYVEGLTGARQARFRGVCTQCGFTSVAVVPLRYREKVLGAVHLADEREGMAPLESVQFIERLAFIIGEAVYRFGIEGERSRLVSAVGSTSDAVVVTDSRGIIQYVNPAFEKITGYTKDEAVGRDMHFLDSGRHGKTFYRELLETLARDGVWSGRLINKKKDGALYYEDCTMSPIKDPEGKNINYVSVRRDVTEKLRLESIAESVNTMENIGYVFSGVRHEIGNPINSINMILGILKSKLDVLPAESMRHYLDRMTEQISRVEYILRSLKSFNLYETQELQDVPLGPFLKNFLPLVREDLEKKGISIETSVDPGAAWAFADPRALQQALLNILTNASDAVEGRDHPTVSMTVCRSGGMVRFRVRDNGCGIPEEKLRDIFKPFYTTKEHGTGLGLVIVKKMLARMNGTVEIESRKDEGTVVDIAVPEGNPDKVGPNH